MAPVTAPERVRATPAPAGVPDSFQPFQPLRRAVEASGRGGPRWSLRRTAAVAGTIVVVSLLMVVTASAYLTQGQVRLTRMQMQLSSELGEHRNLQLRAAQLAEPSTVVSQAELHGLTAPTKETDLPQVDISKSPTTTSTIPTAGTVPVGSTGGR